jgi:hypothetical protein
MLGTEARQKEQLGICKGLPLNLGIIDYVFVLFPKPGSPASAHGGYVTGEVRFNKRLSNEG